MPTHYERRVYQVETAHMNARASWLLPDDDAARELAEQTCALIGISYFDAVAEVMEDTGASADNARYLVAEALHDLATRTLHAAHPDVPTANHQETTP